MKHGATFSRCCGSLNLSPVGSDAETPKASHTNPGVDETKFADFVESKLEIDGVETAILIKSISTFNKNPTVARLGFFILNFFVDSRY